MIHAAFAGASSSLISGNGSADAPQRRVVVLEVVGLVPVAEALSPRKAVVVTRGPVPTGGIRTRFVKCAFQPALVPGFIDLVQFILRGNARTVLGCESHRLFPFEDA